LNGVLVELTSRAAENPRGQLRRRLLAGILCTLDGLGHDWLYIDHGWREMRWATHCNTEVVRWTLRECGVTLAGPPPQSVVAEVPAEAMRHRMRRDVVTLLPDLATWISLDLAWGQRYAFRQVLGDRGRGFDPDDAAQPESVEQTIAFADYAKAIAAR
jgi:hypothetical protein